MFRVTSRLLLVVAMTALSMALAGCGGTDDAADLSAISVHPFSEIQATEFVFENDPGVPDRGIFRVTTTEPTICAIVWGPTEALGNFNNSLAMTGTGIDVHDVALPGAVAGETYYFQVQGSTADGTLYQSELAAFTLPDRDSSAAADTVPAGIGENIALAATVSEVSSEFSDAWAGSNAIDGDPATEWSSTGDAGDAFITLDLGASRAVAGVEFVTRSMTDGSAATLTYSVLVDGGERFGPFAAGTPAERAVQVLAFEGRSLRFEVEETTGGNTGAIEIRVFAPAE